MIIELIDLIITTGTSQFNFEDCINLKGMIKDLGLADKVKNH